MTTPTTPTNPTSRRTSQTIRSELARVLQPSQDASNTCLNAAAYDTGQAAALVTQAQADGLSVHQIGGFDTATVRADFGLDSTLTPIVILAIGRRDGTAELPEPLAAREAAPRARRPLSDLLLPAAAESMPTAA